MKRLSVILMAAALTVAPLASAQAQDRGPRGDRDQREQSGGRREISEAEAQSRAVSRAPRGARLVGSRGRQGNSYVFMFETEDGRTFNISIPVSG